MTSEPQIPGDGASGTPQVRDTWTRLIPDAQMAALHRVAALLSAEGIDALLGGALAIGAHVGHWRGTKDIDFFLRPRDRESAVRALQRAGFSDYHDQLAYDRSWIFRAWCDDELVDLIWTIPNHITEVDDEWLEHAKSLSVEGRTYSVLPVEELIWIKIFVLQRDRCDWPDVINLIRLNAGRIDWERLLERIGDHEPLLLAALHVVEWLAPDAITQVPLWVHSRFHLGERPLPHGREAEAQRATLLDSRPWYAAIVPPTELLLP